MTDINTYSLSYGATVFGSYSIKDEIVTSPEYQRHGDVWTLEKKQLLIDSLLNRFDIPKIYFHKLPENNKGKEYAIIDGRQRLETIWQFIDGNFPLSEDFMYIRDKRVSASGMTYSDLAKDYPKIKNQFDSTGIPIVVVDVDDIDLIEDMFSRLNEAVPLNAAEKRNAIGGHCIAAVNKLSRQHLFTKKVRFSNKRYQHREVAIRLLFIEESLQYAYKLIDTKKVYLDAFAKKYKATGKNKINQLLNDVSEITKYMNSIFIDNDPLLAAQAFIPIYYLVLRHQLEDHGDMTLSRNEIKNFHEIRKNNRELAALDIEHADWELLEFDRLSQQGTNDAGSIKERTRILLENILE